MKGTLAIAAATCFLTRSLDAAEIIDRIILPNWAAAREDMSRQPSIQLALSGPTSDR